ncbi:MAG: hypothetical protein J3K34DRAFT_416046 [Monoraphidium minutum]|nr:MAG: hypothetical protein J3K34DRAFT_416046 [Monoraphidium minutum]
MGRRHSKNAGGMGSEALTYSERKALGFGTVKERMGKDSHGNFYDCSLTLQPVVGPVVTPDGYLYSREAILENLLQQKKAIKRKLAEWEAEQKAEADKATQLAAVEAEAALIAFDRANHMGLRDATARGIQSAITAEAEALAEGRGGAKGVITLRDNQERLKTMNSFWVPQKAPESKASKERPDGATHCPASGGKLRLKDLVDVKFTPVPEGETGRYMDPITKDTFGNASRLVVLAPTGDVMLESTYETCVKPEGSYKGKKVGPKDVIKMQTGGTGFAAHDGDKVQAKKHWLLGPGSGRADLRGQHQGPKSGFGLVFNN